MFIAHVHVFACRHVYTHTQYSIQGSMLLTRYYVYIYIYNIIIYIWDGVQQNHPSGVFILSL